MMKRIISVLFLTIILFGCSRLPGKDADDNIDVTVPETELREIARTKKSYTYRISESSGSYDLEDCDKWGNTVTNTAYAVADDQWFCRQEFLYYPDDKLYQCAVYYNREFYDNYHGQVDWLTVEENDPGLSTWIFRYTCEETLLSEEQYYPDGRHMYQEYYEDGSIRRAKYYEDEKLIYDISSREDGSFSRVEDYVYEDGELVTEFISDYDEGTLLMREYRNGEIVNEDSWKIDEHGNRID